MVSSPRRRGSGRERRKLRRNATYRQIENLLRDPDTRRAWGIQAVESEWERLRKHRERMAGKPQEDVDPPGGLRGGMTCGAPWFDAHWNEGAQYPPGLDESSMVRCKHCQSLCPPQTVSARGRCLDCQYGGMSKGQLARLPGSTSSINLAKVKSAIRRNQQPEGGF